MWQRGRGNTSSFAPYIHLLPSAHHGVPIFFNGEALEMLQYPPLVEQVGGGKAMQSTCFTGTKVQILIVYLIYWYKGTNTDEMLRYPPALVGQVKKRCRFLLELGKELSGKTDGGGLSRHLFASQLVDANTLGYSVYSLYWYKSTRVQKLTQVRQVGALVRLFARLFSRAGCRGDGGSSGGAAIAAAY
jgi:hypothetical protein